MSQLKDLIARFHAAQLEDGVARDAYSETRSDAAYNRCTDTWERVTLTAIAVAEYITEFGDIELDTLDG